MQWTTVCVIELNRAHQTIELSHDSVTRTQLLSHDAPAWSSAEPREPEAKRARCGALESRDPVTGLWMKAGAKRVRRDKGGRFQSAQ